MHLHDIVTEARFNNLAELSKEKVSNKYFYATETFGCNFRKKKKERKRSQKENNLCLHEKEWCSMFNVTKLKHASNGCPINNQVVYVTEGSKHPLLARQS